jgi:hypothetical protein
LPLLCLKLSSYSFLKVRKTFKDEKKTITPFRVKPLKNRFTLKGVLVLKVNDDMFSEFPKGG